MLIAKWDAFLNLRTGPGTFYCTDTLAIAMDKQQRKLPYHHDVQVKSQIRYRHHQLQGAEHTSLQIVAHSHNEGLLGGLGEFVHGWGSWVDGLEQVGRYMGTSHPSLEADESE